MSDKEYSDAIEHIEAQMKDGCLEISEAWDSDEFQVVKQAISLYKNLLTLTGRMNNNEN